MHKFLPVLLFLLAFTKNYSQNLILTKAANEPLVGDSTRTFLLDTSAYVSGLNIAPGGTNMVWTYTNLVTAGNSATSNYLDPSAVPSSSSYPGCTIVQKQGTLYSYYKSVTSPSTQLEFMGVTSTSLSMTFTNTAVYARFPFTYGNTLTDNFSGSFTFSVNGQSNGSATITADATGTLNLPNDTLTDVLRLKSTQTTSLTFFGSPVGSLAMIRYDYYHASQKFPVFSVTHQTITAGGNPTVTAIVTGNKNNFVQALGENSLTEFSTNIFPNPASNVLNISIDPTVKPLEIKILNQLGQTVYADSFTGKVDLSSLSAGIYFIQLKTEKGVVRKKFIKENTNQ